MDTAVSMVPPLVLFMTVIGMFRASGALDVLAHFLSFLTKPLGLPEEVIPLALLRPVSGSASLTVFQQILDTCGPDSFAGRVASVIQSASETTFYTITVYYAAGKIRRQRHTLFCSLAGDLTVIFSASLWDAAFFEGVRAKFLLCCKKMQKSLDFFGKIRYSKKEYRPAGKMPVSVRSSDV